MKAREAPGIEAAQTVLEPLAPSLDRLAAVSEREVADHVRGRLPTFAPAVELHGELLDCVRDLGWLADDAAPVARLWAVFSSGARCEGFDLHAGKARTDPVMWCGRREAGGGWETAIRPRVLSARERAVLRKRPDLREKRDRELSLARRVFELTPALLSDLAEYLEERRTRGAGLIAACTYCGHPLTDHVSIERGIGPECFGKRG